MSIVLLLLGCAGVGGVALMMLTTWANSWRTTPEAFEVRWPEGLSAKAVQQWLANIAASTHPPSWSLLPMPPITIELVADANGVRFYVLTSMVNRHKMLADLRAAVPGARVQPAPDYLAETPAWSVAAELRLTSTVRPLGSDRADGVSAAILASLQPLRAAEEVRLSWMVTSAGTPRPTVWSGSGKTDRQREAADRRALKMKQRAPMLHVAGRVGVAAATGARANTLFGRTWSALHGMNAPGARVVRRWLPSSTVAARLHRRGYPLLRYPMLLNTEELSGLLGLPTAGVRVLGVALGSARQLPPAPSIPTRGMVIATSNYPGMSNRQLALATSDRLRHVLLLGPTGSGKSWLMTRNILSDIEAGRGVFAVDMKGDLIGDVLDRVADKDADRIVVIDPAKRDYPVGLNILAGGHDEASRELVVDNTLNVFKEIWSSSWGPRSDHLMRTALTTLVNSHAPDGSAFTICELGPLLSNSAFRRAVLSRATLPDTVKVAWQRYEAMSDAERAQAIGPVLNKVEAFTSRSAVRLLLGQSQGIELGDIFRRRTAVLVNLPKGVLGTETARLLAALVVSSLWHAILGRVTTPGARRAPAFVYIDEAQDIVRLPVPLADALSQARGLSVGLTLAHQFVAQLPDAVKAAVLGTVRTQIVFGLEYDDAVTMAKRFTPLSASELTSLPAFEVAMRPSVHGQTLAPVTGVTLPLLPPSRDGAALGAASRKRYGTDRATVEASLAARVVVPASGGRLGRQTGAASP